MKRIGIVTYYKNYNYGSILQAFALSKAIDSLGYYAEIIDYLDYGKSFNQGIKKRTYLNKLFTMMKNPFIILPTLRRKKKSLGTVTDRNLEAIKKFDRFTRDNIRLSKENYLSNTYDAVVCGSDQVWRGDTPGLDELFFLRPFEPCKRIAYAPSVGVTEIPTYNIRRFKKYVNEIRYVSVREESAKNIIQQVTGRDIPVVADPVILVGKEFWFSLTQQRLIDKPYVLCYFLDESDSSLAVIEKIEAKSSKKIIWIESGVECDNSNYGIFTPDPLEFVNLIRYADFVYTDSFHASAFSIILHTEFFVFDRNYGEQSNQNTRIDNILRLTGHTQAKYSGHSYGGLYDFEKSDTYLSDIRQESYKYLKAALFEVTRSEK